MSVRIFAGVSPRIVTLAATVAGVLAPLVAWADQTPQPGPSVPEPSGWLVFGLGALGLRWALRRRQRD